MGQWKNKGFHKKESFGIRKLSVGVASVGLASLFVLANVHDVQAQEGGALAGPEVELVSESEAMPSVPEGVEAESVENVSVDNAEKDLTELAEVSSEEGEVSLSSDKIADGSLRLHFKTLPSEEVSSLGLWTWEDVEQPSASLGAWPNAAANFSTAKKDDHGYYLDIKLKESPRKVGFLINNAAGQNLTGDRFVELISPKMNQVWFDQDFKPSYSEPLQAGKVRINYFRTDGNYDRKSLWVWGDIKNVTLGAWPDGIDFVKEGPYGRYIDIDITDSANQIGFLLLDESKTGDEVKIQPADYKMTDISKYSQLFVKDDDPTIYTNPYYVSQVRMLGVGHISTKSLELSFSSLEGLDKEKLAGSLSVVDKDGQAVVWEELTLDIDKKKVLLTGDFKPEKGEYTVTYGGDKLKTRMSWQLKDDLYAYDGELGARVYDEGSRVDLTLWSPSADEVALVLYDKDDQDQVVGKLPLAKGEKGTWYGKLDASNLGLTDYRGYYYHYEIKRGDKTVLVLDPYAKSLAAWNSSTADVSSAHKVAKAAIVAPASVTPEGLDYATIPNFKRREDAIIYEAHVRDFTSDRSIADSLKARFGTFAAFAERLDYLQDLGVTHIQLLPVMSYYDVNEYLSGERLDDYHSSNSNYNWGYDPQSYFALTGMYSSDPTNPLKRIEEFKALVAAIHERGMGVILDVVYNHTARTFIFEDLEPEYYHFMEADGTAKTSFGGGRLGTTHHMSRRVLVDSIKYLTDEYKVDGFRFDMMGDHDAESIRLAFEAAKALNPNIIMLGEGWRTYAGDANTPVTPADQDWMASTDTVAVFSDDIRNTLKSGFPNEGQPAFLTGGAQPIAKVFANIKAQPTNFEADSPGDVIQYIAAHDNLTLYDIIAQSIKKDPTKPENDKEIHKRLRLGNVLVLTSQGTAFLHSGQEYGRTKHFRHDDYRYPVADDKVPNKAHLLVNEDGTPFDYPYYIHDSYDSSDAINHFDWEKATNADRYPENTRSQAYVKGLIALRKSTDAFRLGSKDEVDKRVSLLTIPNENGVGTDDLIMAYQTVASNGDRYAVFVNADKQKRSFALVGQAKDFASGEVLVDGEQAGLTAIANPLGLTIKEDALELAPLTAVVIRIKAQSDTVNSVDEGEHIIGKETDRPVDMEVDFEDVVIPTNPNDTNSAELRARTSNLSSAIQKEDGRELPATGDEATGLAWGLSSILAALGIAPKRRRKK